MLLLQLLLGTEYVPGSVDLLVLCIDCLCLLVAFSSKTRGLGIQIVDSLVERCNMNILLIQLLAKHLEFLILLCNLLLKVCDSLLQLVSLQRAVSHLLLQFSQKFAVLLHTGSDELYILLKLLSLAGTLAVLQNSYSVFSLTNLVQTVLDFIQCTHHIVNFAIFLSDDTIQRIILLICQILGVVLAVVATGQAKSS